MARWNSANRSRWYHLLNKIAEKGHTVIVIQPPSRISEETSYIEVPTQEQKNVVLHTVPISRWFWDMKFPVDKLFKKAFYTIRTFFVLKRLIKEYQADVLILYNIPQYVYTIGNSTPVIFDYADDYVSMLQHELHISSSHPISRFSALILRRLFRKSSLVVTVSHVLQEKIRHNSVIIIPNGANMPVESLEKSTLHIEKGKPVIGYVGAFEYSIDLDLMLSAAEQMEQYTFLLAGAGRDFQRVKKIVAEKKLNNVLLTGAVPHHQAMQCISKMDVCLNLRKKGDIAHAASPIKVFEYLINGKPIVTTRLHELLRLDERGEIFYYADTVEEVVSQIRHILENPAERRKKAEYGKQIALSTYTWDLLAEQFINAAWQLIHPNDNSSRSIQLKKITSDPEGR